MQEFGSLYGFAVGLGTGSIGGVVLGFIDSKLQEQSRAMRIIINAILFGCIIIVGHESEGIPLVCRLGVMLGIILTGLVLPRLIRKTQ